MPGVLVSSRLFLLSPVTAASYHKNYEIVFLIHKFSHVAWSYIICLVLLESTIGNFGKKQVQNINYS
jgi:hypothetical protein